MTDMQLGLDFPAQLGQDSFSFDGSLSEPAPLVIMSELPEFYDAPMEPIDGGSAGDFGIGSQQLQAQQLQAQQAFAMGGPLSVDSSFSAAFMQQQQLYPQQQQQSLLQQQAPQSAAYAAASSGHKRKRDESAALPKSCVKCYLRKVKCSGGRPCERCIKFKIQGCACGVLPMPSVDVRLIVLLVGGAASAWSGRTRTSSVCWARASGSGWRRSRRRRARACRAP